MAQLFHPSGGLAYHLRAWRWRRSLWAPFHVELRRWLDDWCVRVPHLVLVGPSGGYALHAEFLTRFSRISVLEPDPLACWLLRQRFPRVTFEWIGSGPESFHRAGGFAWLAQEFPDAAFLFCNLLGQELLGTPRDFDRAAWLAELEPGLHGRVWASWHDLVSSERAPGRTTGLRCAHALPLDDLLAHFWRGGHLEIHDHETTGLCPELSRLHLIWRISRNRHHLIECLHGS